MPSGSPAAIPHHADDHVPSLSMIVLRRPDRPCDGILLAGRRVLARSILAFHPPAFGMGHNMIDPVIGMVCGLAAWRGHRFLLRKRLTHGSGYRIQWPAMTHRCAGGSSIHYRCSSATMMLPVAAITAAQKTGLSKILRSIPPPQI